MLTALNAEHPPAWTLVVPRNVTVNERKAVWVMRGGHKVTVRFMGPAELDSLLSKHSDINERFTSDNAVELLKAINRPEAALTKPGDLHSEIRRLESRLGGRSEYWGSAFSLSPDGTYVETLYPKRDDAQQREPLSMTVSLEFTADDAEIRDQFELSMKFGAVEPLVLPSHIVKAVDTTGPTWFEEHSEGAEIELRPADLEHSSQRARVELRDADGTTLARLTGVTTSRASGFSGLTVEVQLEGGLGQQWRFPRYAPDPGSVSFRRDFIGSTAHEIRRALKFMDALNVAETVGISLDDGPYLWMQLTAKDPQEGDDAFTEFIDDLCILEEYFDVSLRFPAKAPELSDRIWARILVRLINGEAVAYPDSGAFTATLNGKLDSGLESLLDTGGAIITRYLDFAVTLFGESLQLDEIAYYSHSARVDDAGEVLVALRSGLAEGRQISVRPIDGLPWVIYSPPLLEKAGHETVITRPWGIAGINEHPRFELLPNAEGNQKRKG
jgi:hypothetical protein